MGAPDDATALAAAVQGARAVRFLCSGNVVRSAFAELVALERGFPLPVDSAATRFDNPALFPETRAALLARGVDPARLERFRPRPIWRIQDPPAADLLVIGMTREHLAAWGARHPEHGRRLLFLELLGRPEDLLDPVLDGTDFEATFRTIEQGLERLRELLEQPAP